MRRQASNIEAPVYHTGQPKPWGRQKTTAIGGPRMTYKTGYNRIVQWQSMRHDFECLCKKGSGTVFA